MAMLNGVVESKARAGNSIKVNGDWYGSFKGKGLESIEPGHNVSLVWEYDKTGKYRNIKTVSITGGTASTPVAGTSGTPTNWKPANNIGVELGHASKLAMDLVLTKFAEEFVGNDEFYKEFVFHTDKIYKIMGKLREAKSTPTESAAPTTAVAAKPKEPVLEEEGEDLF